VFLSTVNGPYPTPVTLSPRTPVLVGRSQVVLPHPRAEEPNQPVDLMIDAVRAALADAGLAGSNIDLIGVCNGLFSHPNPGQVIGRAVGAPECASVLTTWGGNTPVAFIAELGDRIRRGDLDVAVMVGGEANASRDELRKAERDRPKPADHPADDPPEAWGAPLIMDAPIDRERGGDLPRNTYAVFESILRAAANETLDASRDLAATLWEGYASVAASNPDLPPTPAASAAEIRNPSATNRMVAWPYTKAMCANNRVDQAGAVILTSLEAAQKLGLAPEQAVYLHGTVTAADTDVLLTRAALPSVPGLDAAVNAVTHRWGPINDFDHIDLYGCFPSIVRYSTAVMGVDRTRPLTVSGGLGFMGAPLNFAAGQSLIAMIRQLRNNPGAMGLVQGNGGHTAKHALGVFSTTPPDQMADITNFDHSRPVVPRADPDLTGAGTVEGVTVEYGHHGPERLVAIARSNDGGRLWVTSTDPEAMTAATSRELIGAEVHLERGIVYL